MHECPFVAFFHKNAGGFCASCFRLSGLVGFIYSAVVIRRARRQTDYKPVREDWLWYTLLPCGSYFALVLTALLLRTNEHIALLIIAAAALGLLLIGIHNAWDSVTHIVLSRAGGETAKQ